MSKIIISTGKYTQSEAKSFAHFILTTLVSYPLFQKLSLNPKHYWGILLFKDEYNFAVVNSTEDVYLISQLYII